MIKGVLFDLDNTLIDFMTMKKRCTEAAVTAMVDAGLNMKKEVAYKRMFTMYKEHGIEDQRIFEKFLKKYNNKVEYKILSAGIVAYRKVKLGQLTPYPHVRSTLMKLRNKGIKLGVISDAPKLQAWPRLTEMNLVEFFDIVLGYEDTGKLKPSSEPFRKALRKMKLKPKEVLFVGDNPKRDVLGAKKVGMRTCLATYGQVFKGRGADYKIEGVEELVGVLR
ncbi:MAG: HAD-IA family hydrolase [Nanoarchaeota archaeon]|nr:HAD-IA family hydrolase [Nanoarchaeota archaeon]MBU1632822.1 HAD-IA family hydrolase [Nanoarchaeota archaeon]MBU1876485.1 HAD-IA family hydrolase [Nanoarchaeota archaeon]